MSDTVKVRWLVPALGHNEGDVTEEPVQMVETCYLPAALVERADVVVATEPRKRPPLTPNNE